MGDRTDVDTQPGPSFSEEEKEAVSEALTALAEGNVEAGVDRVREVARRYPHEVDLLAAMAFQLLLADRSDVIIEILEPIADPPSPSVAVSYGPALVTAGRAEEAVPHLQLALKAEPELGFLHYYLGLALQDPEATLVELREAVRLEPDEEMYRVTLASAVVHDEPGEAIAVLREIDLPPESVTARCVLAVALQKEGRLADAEDVIRSTRTDALLLRLLGEVLEDQGGRDAEALAAYDEASRLAPQDLRAQYAAAAAWNRHERSTEAAVRFRDLLRADPEELAGAGLDRANLRLQLAYALLSGDRYEEVEGCLVELVSEAGEHVSYETHGLLLLVCLLTERFGEAASHYRSTLAATLPETPALSLWNIHLMGGYALLSIREPRDAEHAFRAAIEMNRGHEPGEADARCSLAVALLEQDRLDEAEAEVDRALSAPELRWRDPSARWNAYDTQGSVLTHMGDRFEDRGLYAEAVDALDVAVEMLRDYESPDKSSDVALVHLRRGYAYARMGRYAEARDDFRKSARLAKDHPSVQRLAERNLRRVARARALEPPPALPYVISGFAVAVGLFTAFLALRGDLEGMALVAMVVALFAVGIVAFCLPGITRLKLGGVEFETTTQVVLGSLALAPNFIMGTVRRPDDTPA